MASSGNRFVIIHAFRDISRIYNHLTLGLGDFNAIYPSGVCDNIYIYVTVHEKRDHPPHLVVLCNKPKMFEKLMSGENPYYFSFTNYYYTRS